MSKLLATIVLGLISGLLLAPSPAHADGSADPHIVFPLYRSATAPVEGDTVVQLVAPPRAWGIRRSAQTIDALIPGLTIRTTGTCSGNPTAACVRVEIGTYGREQQAAMSGMPDTVWGGLCYPVAVGPRVVYLNRYKEQGWVLGTAKKRLIAAHELGHALGLDHHYGVGLMNPADTSGALSAAEVAVLTDWFSEPRYRA